VLWGTRDLIMSPRHAERLRARIDHPDVRRQPGLDHIPLSDYPG
jgi:hypothetical protein